MQGTPPFIAIELLIHGSPHHTAHNLEFILYVLLFICTHLKGPGCQVRDPPLYGGDNKSIHPSSIKQWFAASHLATLGHLKFSHMMSHFNTFILSAISPYFFPLKNYIGNFWKALILERESIASDGEWVVHSKATPQDIINVLKAALLDTELISEHKSLENDQFLATSFLIQAGIRWKHPKISGWQIQRSPHIIPGILNSWRSTNDLLPHRPHNHCRNCWVHSSWNWSVHFLFSYTCPLPSFTSFAFAFVLVFVWFFILFYMLFKFVILRVVVLIVIFLLNSRASWINGHRDCWLQWSRILITSI